MQKKSNAFKRFASGTGFKLLIVLIILIIVAVLLTSDVLKGGSPFGKGFFSSINLRSLLYKLVLPLFMLSGLGMLLISGNIDLSVAAQATLCNAFFAVMMRDTNLPWWVVFIMALPFVMRGSGFCFCGGRCPSSTRTTCSRCRRS